MFQDNWLWGWGAGSYRFYFPIYQQAYPEHWGIGSKRFVWYHAHNDWLEYLTEYGVVGCGLAALMLIYFIEKIVLRAASFASCSIAASLPSLSTLPLTLSYRALRSY